MTPMTDRTMLQSANELQAQSQALRQTTSAAHAQAHQYHSQITTLKMTIRNLKLELEEKDQIIAMLESRDD